jgi:pimeloyl-ACP methyl ester carboxylesterase
LSEPKNRSGGCYLLEEMNMSLFWIKFGIVFIGIALVGMAAIIVRYRREIQIARQRIDRLGSQVVQTASGPVEYARSGEGYPILVVHGAFGGFDQGLWVANSFDFSKYQVISISRFGYLGSPLPPRADLNLQADAFASLLDVLDFQKVAVFAISAGSTSAIRFAGRHPGRVSALILLGPDAPGETYMSMPPQSILNVLMHSDFLYWAMITFLGKKARSWIGLVPKGYRLTPEYAGLVDRVQAGDLPVSRRVEGEIFESYTLFDEFKASVTPTSPYPLIKNQTPTLVISAADDPISLPENVRALADQMPNARLYTVPDGGHLFFGHAEEIKAEIAHFLSSHLG